MTIKTVYTAPTVAGGTFTPPADNAYNLGSSTLRWQNAFLSSFIEGDEISDPAAPAANKGRVYFKDNGAGKTQYVVRFPTGAVQVIATEP